MLGSYKSQYNIGAFKLQNISYFYFVKQFNFVVYKSVKYKRTDALSLWHQQ